MKLYKYTFKSPLSGSISCERLFSDTDGICELDAEEMVRIYDNDPRLAEFLDNNREDFTEYTPEELESYVHKMEIGNHALLGGSLYLLSYVWTTSRMSDEQAQAVMSYLSGQFSDGWGEGLEQREWRKDEITIDKPYFDVCEGEWDEDIEYADAFFYVHPWSSRQFFIELHECEEEEVDDPQPNVNEELRRTLLKVKELINEIMEELKTVE